MFIPIYIKRLYSSIKKLPLLAILFMFISGGEIAHSATNDLWDISNGSSVTANSGVLNYRPTYKSDINDMFGGSSAVIGPGVTLFQDFQSTGFLHWVEWEADTLVTLKSFVLDAAHDGSSRDARYRGFSLFTLYVKNSDGDFEEIFQISPANPYGDTLPPANTTINTVADKSRLILCANIAQVQAREFRAEFTQFGDVSSIASGPRIIELDGFDTLCPGLATDSDNDGEPDDSDNCPDTPNPGQTNTDGDDQGDACDDDDDNDGQTDLDEMTCGSDPTDSASTSPDNDGDNSPDCVDADDDNDGVDDVNDAFPLDPNESSDNDDDGTGDNADLDDDNDGQTDVDETTCGSDPLNAASTALDTDGDNSPDCVDTDDDNDGVLDANDACSDSNQSSTVVIDGLDTGVENVIDSSGCTISDLIEVCITSVSNHGEFVSCIAHLTNTLKKEGMLSGKDKGVIQRSAAQADIP